MYKKVWLVSPTILNKSNLQINHVLIEWIMKSTYFAQNWFSKDQFQIVWNFSETSYNNPWIPNFPQNCILSSTGYLRHKGPKDIWSMKKYSTKIAEGKGSNLPVGRGNWTRNQIWRGRQSFWRLFGCLLHLRSKSSTRGVVERQHGPPLSLLSVHSLLLPSLLWNL